MRGYFIARYILSSDQVTAVASSLREGILLPGTFSLLIRSQQLPAASGRVFYCQVHSLFWSGHSSCQQPQGGYFIARYILSPDQVTAVASSLSEGILLPDIFSLLIRSQQLPAASGRVFYCQVHSLSWSGHSSCQQPQWGYFIARYILSPDQVTAVASSLSEGILLPGIFSLLIRSQQLPAASVRVFYCQIYSLSWSGHSSCQQPQWGYFIARYILSPDQVTAVASSLREGILLQGIFSLLIRSQQLPAASGRVFYCQV